MWAHHVDQIDVILGYRTARQLHRRALFSKRPTTGGNVNPLDTIDPELFENLFATLTTLGPSGDPQSTIVWYRVEDGTILISATARRKKTKNLAADSRCSLLVCHPSTANYYVEIRGSAVVVDDADYAVADRISPRYDADFRRFDSPTDRRTAIVLTPDKVIVTDVRSH